MPAKSRITAAIDGPPAGPGPGRRYGGPVRVRVGAWVGALLGVLPAAVATARPEDRPPPLESPPIAAQVIYESPWVASAALVVVAVALVIAFRRSRPRRAAWVAPAAAVLAAAALVVTASMVTTPRESMRAATTRLVAAVAAADAEGVGRLLADDVRLDFAASGGELGRDAILAAVRRLGTPPAVRTHSVLELQAQMDGPAVGRVQARVRVVEADYGSPWTSWWRLDFRRAGTGWSVVRIRSLSTELNPAAVR